MMSEIREEFNDLTLNNLNHKLMCDGSDKVRLKTNLVSMSIGCVFLFAGVAGLVIKTFLENDANPEKFYLIPISILLTFCGALVFAITGIRNTYFLFRSQKKDIRYKYLSTSLGCSSIVLGYIAMIMFVIEANSGKRIMPLFFLFIVMALALAVTTLVLKIRLNWKCRQ